MLILGLDPGKTTGIVLMESERQKWRPMIWKSTNISPELEIEGICARVGIHTSHIDLIAVESVSSIYPRARFTVKMANAIQNSTRVEERILAEARRLGLKTETCSAAEWRRGLCGGKGSSSDAAVKRWLTAYLTFMPETNAHCRDAMGTAICCAIKCKMRRQ